MLPGNLYSQNGKVMSFAIEKTTGAGSVTAFDPGSQEQFSGSYVAVLGNTTTNTHAMVANTSGWVAGNATESSGSNMADGTAYLRGDKGTMLSCTMRIQAGVYPHGIGDCTDNHRATYRLQF
jgi:formylmethanofuran dehydrogenase subunit C